jgi:DNA-binding CsgD family transcriptional regulator
MNQKSDETLQELETRFEVQEKERKLERRGYQITLLLMLVLLAAAIIVIAVNHIRRVRRRNDELKRINDTKEQLIEILSKDLRNPAQAYRSDLEKLSEDAATLDSGQIRERCRAIAENAQSMNEDVARYVGDLLIERGRRIADLGLSKREIEIIRLSSEGLTAAQIAEKLFLSVHTVNTHRQRIYAKMDVKNVSDMLHAASELGII